MAQGEQKRRYDSTLREQQAELTRTRIMDTAVELLMEDVGFTTSALSSRSGVSAATIYRHYPNREALLDGVVGHLARATNAPELPTDRAGIRANAETILHYYERNEQVLAARSLTASLREVTRHGHKLRDATLIDALCEGSVLPPDRARPRAALMRWVIGSSTWNALRDRFELSPEQTREAMLWAANALLDAADDEGGAP